MKRKVLLFAAICFCFAFVFDVDAQQRKRNGRPAGKSGLVIITVDEQGREVKRKRVKQFALAMDGIDENGRLVLRQVEPAETKSVPSGQQHRRAKPLRSQTEQSSSRAEIIVENANLRVSPDASSEVIREVAFGESLSISGNERVGAWYKVADEKTGKEGWLHGNTFKIVRSDGERTKPNDAEKSATGELFELQGGNVKSVNSRTIVLEIGDETQSFVINNKTRICVNGRQVASWRELVNAKFVNISTKPESKIALEIYYGRAMMCIP